jgi:hypothetical protein
MHHGYLLTGIARPSTTANEAYDSLFLSLPQPQEKIIDDDEDNISQMGETATFRKGIYNMMKLEWEYKYHSYEYFKFMSRAYQTLYKKLAPRLQPDEVDDATSRELFNFRRARALRYLNSSKDEMIMH